jgi:probable F420-dependent oxidoreductase
MPVVRPFRFGAAHFTAASAAAWAEGARRIEALGYSTLLMADHPAGRSFATVPALVAAALATTTLRVDCTVFDNDFRHPALLAKEAATADVLSGGRLELGIGAGWDKPEYDRLGLRFDPPGTRVERMEEGLAVIKGLWGDGPFTFAGRHYAITGIDGMPKPLQRPHPPVFIGAGGKRLLSFAAREADVVGILDRARPDGSGLDVGEETEESMARKIGWVREAAGDRFDRLELAALMWGVAVTDDRRAGAERLRPDLGLTPEQVLASPYFLVGSTEAIAERLLELRERHGVSYITVFPQDVEPFAPVVARLAGK